MSLSRRKPPKAPKVYRVPGIHPLPELAKVEVYSHLPGGLPPVPNRTPWGRAGLTGKGARDPFNSRAVKGEYWATKRYLEV